MDFTTSTVPAWLDEGEVKCSRGLRAMIDAGVDVSQITFTSDGQGSLPAFDARGPAAAARRRPRDEPVRRGARRGASASGFRSRRRCRWSRRIPARILKLRGKGQLVAGADADLVLLEPRTLEMRGVIARGRWLMRDGEVVVKGTFE